MEATPASAVIVPERIVELKDLVALGGPVRVKVKRISRLAIARVLKNLPSARDPVAENAERTAEETLEFAIEVEAKAREVVVLAAAEPKFGPDGLDPEILTERDLIELFNATLELSGWTEVQADEASFPTGGRGGRGAGVGAVETIGTGNAITDGGPEFTVAGVR